ncbi:D-xylose ABC transporter substrate-binding protein [Agathobaculum sp. TL06]
MRKRIWSTLTCFALLAAALTGCSSSQDVAGDKAAADDGIKIGIAFKTLQEEVWESERAQLEKRADEAGVELIYTDAGNNATTQNDQMENLIAQGVDVLLVAPVDFEGAAAGVAAAKAAGIPVISYTDIVSSDQQDYIVTFDYHAIGIHNAERAIEAVPQGKYVLLNGEDADSLPHDINDGYHKVLDPYVESGDIEIVFDQYMSHWSADEALAAMENVLTMNGNDIQAVICNNDSIASGAIQALTAQGLQGKVYVAGMDGEITALQRVAEGTQNVTVYTGHAPYADIVFDTALSVAKGEEPSGITGTREVNGKEIPVIQAEPIYVNQDNIYETMIESGLCKLEDVYANIPETEWPSAS